MTDEHAELIHSSLDQGVLEIRLNRPEKMNALNEAMHLQLRAAFQRAHDQPEIRAVLLTAAGRVFCSGQDLGKRDPRQGGPRPDLGHSLETFYNPTIRLIRALPKPVVCAMQGAAAGAGISLALASDIVLASENARFVLSFARLGLVPDAGASWFLARLLGEARAKAIALSGEPVSAPEAERLGLIWRALPEAALPGEARALAIRLAAGPTLGIGSTKILLQEAAASDLDAQLDRERDLQRVTGFSDDYAEGVTAFLEKRPAEFQGR